MILYIFKAGGGYFGGATGVIADSPDHALTLIEEHRVAVKATGEYDPFDDERFHLTDTTVRQGEWYWVLAHEVELAPHYLEPRVLFTEWNSG